LVAARGRDAAEAIPTKIQPRNSGDDSSPDFGASNRADHDSEKLFGNFAHDFL
jgi:hypothetical protein